MKFSLPILLPTAAVAAVAVVIAVVIVQPGMWSTPGTTPAPLFANNFTVTREESNAFGSLAYAPNGAGGDAALGSYAARSQSGGGGGIPAAAPAPMPPMADASMVKQSENAVADTSMIAPDYAYERARYVYDGPELSLEPQGSVYRRVKRPLAAGDLASTLRTLSFGMVDLNSFGSLNLQQFSLTQSGQFGYQFYVDLNEGSININENYQTWARPEAACRDEACFEQYRLKPTDVKPDADLIAITNAFLKDHGISKEAYGEPVVDRRWSVMPYLKAVPSEMDRSRLIYVPETVTVQYPVKLDNVQAYDQSGFAYGLALSVNIRHNRVSSAWNLTTQEYQSSSYDLVTDAAKILDVASRGDTYSMPFGQDPNEIVREVKLGEPTRILMQTWRPTPDGMSGEELLVPALRFPVIAAEDGFTGFRDSVVVPLVNDLLTPPVVIPYGRGAAGGVTPLINQTDPAVSTPPPATEPAAPKAF